MPDIPDINDIRTGLPDPIVIVLPPDSGKKRSRSSLRRYDAE